MNLLVMSETMSDVSRTYSLLSCKVNWSSHAMYSLKKQDGRRDTLKTLSCSLWELILVVCHGPDTMYFSDI